MTEQLKLCPSMCKGPIERDGANGPVTCMVCGFFAPSVDAWNSRQSPWISVSERLPDGGEGHGHVYVFTPEVDKSMRYRVVPVDLFKQVCTDATHWQYCTAP